jgi:hypothetical protein
MRRADPGAAGAANNGDENSAPLCVACSHCAAAAVAHSIVSPWNMAYRRNRVELRWPTDVPSKHMSKGASQEGHDKIAGKDDIHRQMETLKGRLLSLDRERSEISKKLDVLERICAEETAKRALLSSSRTTAASPAAEKIALFRSLFRGRDDVFPRRWRNHKTGKTGYAPACRNEWVRDVCGKPQVKCGECPNQAFIPVSDDVVRSHLAGKAPGDSADFTIGVYPMLPDETCWLLVADFDKKSWMTDAAAFRDAARAKGVPIAIERSRSGNGAHAWIFFAEPIPAAEARRLGALLITATMERCPDIGFDSYDRFFPSQDTMPVGGFGNLIALPLQNKPRENGNSMFVDDNYHPYSDQWSFLSAVERNRVIR